mmetsp:Transcript_3754/g.7226  ORF Transcript_3754/g.7226 Transcript_3754/m.7226 type:complete len:205 (-) Transcript_3754:56-670(-)
MHACSLAWTDRRQIPHAGWCEVCLFQGLLCLFVGGTADCRVVAQYALRIKGEQSIPSPACMREPARLRLHACACTPSCAWVPARVTFAHSLEVHVHACPHLRAYLRPCDCPCTHARAFLQLHACKLACTPHSALLSIASARLPVCLCLNSCACLHPPHACTPDTRLRCLHASACTSAPSSFRLHTCGSTSNSSGSVSPCCTRRP